MVRKSLGVALFLAASAPGWLFLTEPSDVPRGEQPLGAAVEAIRRADYRGDRAELLRQAEALRAGSLPANRERREYREYWTGFAYWRRAMNGFNETPAPRDLFDDLERCAAHERTAFALDAAFEDARGALLGCLMSQAFLAPQLPPEKRTAVVRELVEVLKAVAPKAEANPRSLWLVGGNEIYAPPPYGGDAARGIATYQRGLAAARKEALSTAAREPWVPSWGAPELLMSLAYVNAHGAVPNREVARAYAEGALAMVPDWHYVRDILLPQIDELAVAHAAAAECESKKPEGGTHD